MTEDRINPRDVNLDPLVGTRGIVETLVRANLNVFAKTDDRERLQVVEVLTNGDREEFKRFAIEARNHFLSTEKPTMKDDEVSHILPDGTVSFVVNYESGQSSRFVLPPHIFSADNTSEFGTFHQKVPSQETVSLIRDVLDTISIDRDPSEFVEDFLTEDGSLTQRAKLGIAQLIYLQNIVGSAVENTTIGSIQLGVELGGLCDSYAQPPELTEKEPSPVSLATEHEYPDEEMARPSFEAFRRNYQLAVEAVAEIDDPMIIIRAEAELDDPMIIRAEAVLLRASILSGNTDEVKVLRQKIIDSVYQTDPGKQLSVFLTIMDALQFDADEQTSEHILSDIDAAKDYFTGTKPEKVDHLARVGVLMRRFNRPRESASYFRDATLLARHRTKGPLRLYCESLIAMRQVEAGIKNKSVIEKLRKRWEKMWESHDTDDREATAYLSGASDSLLAAMNRSYEYPTSLRSPHHNYILYSSPGYQGYVNDILRYVGDYETFRQKPSYSLSMVDHKRLSNAYPFYVEDQARLFFDSLDRGSVLLPLVAVMAVAEMADFLSPSDCRDHLNVAEETVAVFREIAESEYGKRNFFEKSLRDYLAEMYAYLAVGWIKMK